MDQEYFGDGKDLGRYYVTESKDIYKFKTPSLINATITDYHNGSDSIIVEVIKNILIPYIKLIIIKKMVSF